MTQTKQTLSFLGIAFAFSWLCWLPAVLIVQGFAVPPGVEQIINIVSPFGAWGPLVAALSVTAMADGKAGLKSLLKRVVGFRIGAFWYVVSLALFPLLIGGSLAVAVLSGEPIPEMAAFDQLLGLPIAFVFILLLGGPLQEELGWRGILQERLQERWNALIAAVVVGSTWGLWHLPLFFLPREEFYYNRPMWGLIVTTMLISVLFAWVYNNTKRSLWAVLLLHASFNWGHYLFPALGSDVAGVTLFGFQAALALIVVWVCGAKTLVRT